MQSAEQDIRSWKPCWGRCLTAQGGLHSSCSVVKCGSRATACYEWRPKSHYSRAEAVVALVHEHAGTGLAAVAISSNSVASHPQDGPDRMLEDAKQFGDSATPFLTRLYFRESCLSSWDQMQAQAAVSSDQWQLGTGVLYLRQARLSSTEPVSKCCGPIPPGPATQLFAMKLGHDGLRFARV